MAVNCIVNRVKYIFAIPCEYKHWQLCLVYNYNLHQKTYVDFTRKSTQLLNPNGNYCKHCHIFLCIEK